MLPVPVLLASMLNTTVPPGAEALSVTVSFGTKPIGEVGAVKVIVWLALLTTGFWVPVLDAYVPCGWYSLRIC